MGKTNHFNPNETNHGYSNFIHYILLMLIGISASIFLIKLSFLISRGCNLTHVAGAWITLAMDFSEGIFYRPLYSEDIGYGGTRFFPLYFSIHGLMIKLFGRPILTGHIISLTSGLFLFSSCYLLLNQLKTSRIIIFGLLVLALSEASIQIGLSTIRGDILPLAFNIAGLTFYLSKYPLKYKLVLTSMCFILAFATKTTSINGFLALLIWLLLNNKNKEALMISLITISGFFVFICILYFSTSTRILTILQTCSSGGATFYSILKAPISFAYKLTTEDPICLLFLFWALICMCKNYRILKLNLPFLFFLVSLVLTIILFGSPGISINHFVDISISSIIFIGSIEFTNSSKDLRSAVFTYMFLVLFLSVFSMANLRSSITDSKSNRTILYPKKIIDFIKQNDTIILSENPMLPIIAGEKPYLLDAFMLRLMIKKNPQLKAELFKNLDNKKFSTIIFRRDPLDEVNKDWYHRSHFGADFIENVTRNYKVWIKTGNCVAFLPKR